jgi:hypothetical protein
MATCRSGGVDFAAQGHGAVISVQNLFALGIQGVYRGHVYS